MGGRGRGGLMVPKCGRRASCAPGGPGVGMSSVQAARRASSRSETGISLFPGMLGGKVLQNSKVGKTTYNVFFIHMP